MTTKSTKTIAVYPGDGIGPEVMAVATRALTALNAPIELVQVELRPERRDTKAVAELIASAGILFKAPCDVEDSLESDEAWGDLFATYAKRYEFRTRQGVESPTRKGPGADITLIRRFRDDPANLEEMRDGEKVRCVQTLSRATCERVHRYAFDTARRRGKTHVTCAHSAELKEVTGGLFLETFREVAADYPDLTTDEVDVTQLCKRVVEAPHELSLIVAEEIEGRILAGVCAGLVGGLRQVPTTRKGTRVKVFQTHHGAAAAIAGTGTANPTALVASAVMMLRYLDLTEAADRLEEALHGTLIEMSRRPDLGVAPLPFRTERFETILLGRLDAGSADAPSRAAQALEITLRSTEDEGALRARLSELVPDSISLTNLRRVGDGFRIRLEASEEAGPTGLLTLATAIAERQPVSAVSLARAVAVAE